MPINLISCVINYKNKLAIGRDNGLLLKLKEDLKFFKTITSKNDNDTFNSKIDRNVVLMGRKTWFSIPRERRPLKDRLNLVLTNDKDLIKLSPYPTFPWCKFTKNVYFITYKQFLDFYKRTSANVFVIGGGQIYDLFLNNKDENLLPQKIYLTEVYDFKPEQGLEPDCFMSHFNERYRLVNVSDKHNDNVYNVTFRFLEYNYYHNYRTDEKQYIDLCCKVLKNGNERIDRTNVGTISIFGDKMEFDISDTVPLLTTKRVPWKHCIEELLWFMRGDTDTKILQRRGVKIWDGNTSREFLDNKGLTHYDEGILGPGYSWQWRFFGANYSQAFSDTSNVDTSKIGGFDQLQYVIDTLKNDPFNRRIMMSYWNPLHMNEMALPPCHYSVLFYVEEENDEKYLSCLFTMRSNDMFLGNPFNIFSYTVLTYILALKCNMKPRRLVYMGGDIHIYKNHLAQMTEQLNRTPRPLPQLKINSDVKDKAISDITVEDFEIIGYHPHSSIRAPMAI
jgi:thymidylate synthase|uniref:thymidylate synthase n=1 Tax=viral metagenome TaxID=1070528 RepID=A0A6C0ALX5_9ZZZZ